MNVALDTNVLVYAEGIDDSARETIASRLTDRLPLESTFLSTQVLVELFNVLVRRGRALHSARQAVLEWHDIFRTVPTGPATALIALELAVRHRLVIWDALILAAAAEAGCSVLLSEDFQEGFTWQGVTVCNPFLPKPHPLIAELVRE